MLIEKFQIKWRSATGKEESVHNTGWEKRCSSGTESKKTGESNRTKKVILGEVIKVGRNENYFQNRIHKSGKSCFDKRVTFYGRYCRFQKNC